MLDIYDFCTSGNKKKYYTTSCLMAWWLHNSVTMHVTKVYFIQLVLEIKYVEFEDKPNNFYLKNENVKVFLLEDL